MAKNIQNMGRIDPRELEAEKSSTRSGGTEKRQGKLVVRQKDLPTGDPGVRFRILPVPGKTIPWVQVEAHAFWHPGMGQGAFFNCLGHNCPGEVFVDQLKGRISDIEGEEGFDPKNTSADYKLLNKLAEGRAKSKFYANVIFTEWMGGPVPPDMQGLKVFEFGLGIKRGTDKQGTGGLLRLAGECDDLANPSDGPIVTIVKTGVKLETNYAVDLVKEEAEVEIRGRKTRQKVVTMAGPIVPENEMPSFLRNLRDMSMFTKSESADEIRVKINAINPLGSLSKTSRSAPRDFRNAAQDIEASASFGKPGSDDDIPF